MTPKLNVRPVVPLNAKAAELLAKRGRRELPAESQVARLRRQRDAFAGFLATLRRAAKRGR
jgi:hypothetical protein